MRIRTRERWGSTEILEAFLLAFQSAEKTIYITQIYFILNSRVLNSFIDAAQRGVDVKIILPEHSDVRLAKSASEISYEELLEGGIRIFERKGSMLHIKAMVIDSISSTLGSCNIDDRLFLLNYECNVAVYNEEFGNAMEKMFIEDFENCNEITLDNWEKRSWWKRKGGENMLRELIKKAFAKTKSQKEAGRLLGCYACADEEPRKYSIFRQECTKLGVKIRDYK